MVYLADDRIISFRGDLPRNWENIVLPIDKPGGMTSFDIIRNLRRILGIRKIGHAGTLDPMATGLLVCLIGRATKRMNEFLEESKTYTGVIRLGESTPSFDTDTEIIERRPITGVSRVDIEAVCRSFLGTIIQSTPMYSAVKVGGERLYRKARRGETVKTPLRVVTIESFGVGTLQGSDLDFELRCSTGTYVRAIASEFGEKLGVGAHLVELRRIRIGDLSVENAWSIEALARSIQKAGERSV